MKIDVSPSDMYSLLSDSHRVAFWFKRCPECSALSFPPGLPSCAACGLSLDAVPNQAHEAPCILREFVTLHVPLVPGIATPVVLGDIEIAPGVVRQGVLAVDSEAQLTLGQQVEPVFSPGDGVTSARCVFRPMQGYSTNA
ncbi:hypothetical protein [Comamonas sp. C11]|uniref:hypothetical protein n=1 Tax=Comamonas sp. C11 TaxID=2966554 RepID=UPI0021115CF2|nr:hypothetical protein [Comamonas sp. C11]UUC96738.1 hypothetical protein NOX35_28545 [Comamonas sp. C11]